MHSQLGDVHGTWRAMEELYKAGKIRAIGVSNFYNDRLMDLIVHNEIVPAINQVETHPFYQQEEAQKFMKENNVQIESWGPLAEGRNNIFNNEILKSIGEKYNKSVAQVILRWLTQRGVIVIPKTVNKERMEENLNVFDFDLSTQDMETIKTLDDSTGSMFDFRDPATVKWFGEYKIGDLI
jgi:2,5-diketo-D-gluconate reductase A